MNAKSPILLVGVGGAGSAAALKVREAFGAPMRIVLSDTDAATGREDAPFVLLGGDRLSGRGSGGDTVQARLAAEDSAKSFDEHLDGVRLAVVTAAMGGGTGSGATYEIVRHFAELGVPAVVFATIPFSFEGEDRQRRCAGMKSMVEDAASAAFFAPLDDLVGECDNMDEAMRRAYESLAAGVTLFWRLLEKPGYIRLDAERVRAMLSGAGRARFAVATASGENRAGTVSDAIARSPLLAHGSAPVRSILCGVLAGEDLRLSEISRIADGMRDAFGHSCRFELATVNDEETFSGKISVVAMLFEAGQEDAPEESSGQSAPKGQRRSRRGGQSALAPGSRTDRFSNVEPTVWKGENLDIPTYVRRSITLEI